MINGQILYGIKSLGGVRGRKKGEVTGFDENPWGCKNTIACMEDMNPKIKGKLVVVKVKVSWEELPMLKKDYK
jgi:hypothetical protein